MKDDPIEEENILFLFFNGTYMIIHVNHFQKNQNWIAVKYFEWSKLSENNF